MSRSPLTASAILLFSIPVLAQSPQAVQIRIDLTDAPRRIIHVTEQLPVHPGDNIFCYPKWIPGRERADGPIDNLTGIFFRAANSQGAPIAWRQDLEDPYKIHVSIPSRVSSLTASFDLLGAPSHAQPAEKNHTSSHVVMVEPSDVVLYPLDKPVRDTQITATIHLPRSWKAATALRTAGSDAPSLNGPDTTFKTVSIEKFVDSPILAGDHCRQYPLAPEIRPVHTLDVCTEKEADLTLQPAFLAKMTALVQQATKVFAGHHYDHYDFLVAASPHLSGDSTEHTESADYVVSSVDTSNPLTSDNLAYLLPHEYTHSWCGKYRRPAGMATPDYNTPMRTDLIWVYEGLTQYYGNVLAARAGFRTPADTVSALDFEAFQIDRPGRRWRSVQGTADASAILRSGDVVWSNWRLDQDYYLAGTLLWLEADVKIRQLTHGAKSLDDFAALFFSPPIPGSSSRDTGPGIIPYAFADLVQALNATAPYDWTSFWNTRLNALDFKLLTRGLEAGGYDYVYQDTMIPSEGDYIKAAHMAEMYHSLGFQAMPDGTLQDVWMDSPAYIAGLGPGDKLTAVNGKPYSAEVLTYAVHESKTNTGPINLTVSRYGESQTFALQYHGGEKYAALVRNNNPDLLTTAILKPR